MPPSYLRTKTITHSPSTKGHLCFFIHSFTSPDLLKCEVSFNCSVRDLLAVPWPLCLHLQVSRNLLNMSKNTSDIIRPFDVLVAALSHVSSFCSDFIPMRKLSLVFASVQVSEVITVRFWTWIFQALTLLTSAPKAIKGRREKWRRSWKKVRNVLRLQRFEQYNKVKPEKKQKAVVGDESAEEKRGFVRLLL